MFFYMFIEKKLRTMSSRPTEPSVNKLNFPFSDLNVARELRTAEFSIKI